MNHTVVTYFDKLGHYRMSDQVEVKMPPSDSDIFTNNSGLLLYKITI